MKDATLLKWNSLCFKYKIQFNDTGHGSREVQQLKHKIKLCMFEGINVPIILRNRN